MRLSHTLARTSTVFDDPNLVSSAGLVPILALADPAGLQDLADGHLRVPTDSWPGVGEVAVTVVHERRRSVCCGSSSLLAALRPS